MTELHTKVQDSIVNICKSIGLEVEKEHRGNDYISDVFASDGNNKFVLVLYEITIIFIHKIQKKYRK